MLRTESGGTVQVVPEPVHELAAAYVDSAQRQVQSFAQRMLTSAAAISELLGPSVPERDQILMVSPAPNFARCSLLRIPGSKAQILNGIVHIPTSLIS